MGQPLVLPGVVAVASPWIAACAPMDSDVPPPQNLAAAGLGPGRPAVKGYRYFDDIHDHADSTVTALDVTFTNWQSIDGAAEASPTGFYDVGLEFKAHPPSQREFGWLCDADPFYHPWDGFINRGEHEGVFFDRYGRCNGTVSWEAVLDRNGLYAVELLFGVVMGMAVGLLGGDTGCTLNGRRLGWRGGGYQAQTWSALVTDKRLRLGGPSEACGLIKRVTARKLFPRAGDTDCWRDTGLEYHLCCVPGFVQASCFRGPYTYERCCRTPKRSAKIHGSLPLVPAPRRPCITHYCQRHCVGASAEFYASPPAWVTQAPDPAPLRCEGHLIYPLSYSIPGEFVVECIPPKTADFALLWPRDETTYVFDVGTDPTAATLEYFRMYQSALFAITATKNGPDSYRHLEILASGAVPFFLDLDRVSVNTMAQYPKDLLWRAKELPGVDAGMLHEDEFNTSAYIELAQDLLQWTRHRLTTAAMAEYVLRVLGVPREAYPVLRVLVICAPSFLRRGQRWGPGSAFNIVHGLREVLAPANVLDYPLYDEWYEPDPLRPFGVSLPRPELRYLSWRWRLQRLQGVNRTLASLRGQLARSEFDYVVYGWLEECDLEAHIAAHVPRERLVAIDGFDNTPQFLMDWARRVGYLFKNTLASSCPEPGRRH